MGAVFLGVELLKLIFDIAVEANLIETTPVSARLHRPKVETGEKPTLTPKQIRNVLTHIREEWKALFFLRSGLGTSLRKTSCAAAEKRRLAHGRTAHHAQLVET